MPAGTLYWNLDAREGEQWTSAIGSFKITTRSKTVNASGQTYRNCIQVRETNQQGNQLFWTFAPGVGFVQFGEGRGAFVLESAPSESSARPSRRSDDGRARS